MKKFTSILMAMALVASLCACAQTETTTETTAAATEAATTAAATTAAATTAAATTAAETTAAAAEPTELIVFAAASMTETLTEIGEKYMAAHPDVKISFNFDSSGTLKTQIQEGADCDVFISAAPKQMNQLDSSCDAEKNPDGLDFVLQGTRVNLLENKVALAVPEGNPKNIKSYDDLIAGLKDGSIMLAMGNADVPVGQYTQKILAYFNLSEDDLAKAGNITYGSNVKEVTTQVSEGTVDAGIIYATDAFSAKLNVVDTATKDMCGQVIYPAAVLNITKNQEAAQAFLDYLKSDEASEVFEAVGFTALSKAAETQASSEPVELIVFAAASMTETLTEIGDKYMAANPNVKLSFNFDSSGTLKTQIQEGADCDVFISAAPKQMNQLDSSCDAEKNPDGLDFVLQGTRIDLLENKVALAVPDGNPKNIKSYDDLVAGLKDGTVMLAMGNSDVPVGQYTQKILAYYDLNEEDLAKAGVITYGSNVKEVTTQVSEATVDAGIIYATDAFSAKLEVVDTATKEMCGQVIYPAAVLNITKNQEAAQAFLDYLTGDEATAVFEAVGFTALN